MQLLVLNSIAQNQSPIIVKDNMVWLGYYNSINLNQKWSINSDTQFRTKNEIKDCSQALIRTGVTYKLGERLELSLGLAHFRYFIDNQSTRGEWRPWQELKLSNKLGIIKLIQRLRIEQRFNETVSNSESANNFQFNYRFRYRFDFRVPIIKEKETGNNWYALIGNEFMINAGNIITTNYFDQNRVYAGLNYEINKNISLQFQYMYVWQQATNGLTLNSNNVLRFNIYHTISI